jgi:hypothetical protein
MTPRERHLISILYEALMAPPSQAHGTLVQGLLLWAPNARSAERTLGAARRGLGDPSLACLTIRALSDHDLIIFHKQPDER